MRISRLMIALAASVIAAVMLIANPAVAAPDTSPSAGYLVTVTGTVDTRTVLGCTILNGDDGRWYDLKGGDPRVLVHDARVLVRGELIPDVMTTCMRGHLVKVTLAQRI